MRSSRVLAGMVTVGLVAGAAFGAGCEGTVNTESGGSGPTAGGGPGGVEPFCGDGNIDPGEECDDGNGAGSDACSSTCTVSLLLLTPPNGIAEWPDVTATAHDGGHGFLVAWREASPGGGLTTVAISGKGAVDATAVVPGGELLPGVAPLPEGRVFVAARNASVSLEGSVVDASSLAVLEEPALTFDGPITSYYLELAVSEIAEVAMVYSEPWNDATMSLPVKACVLYPDVACMYLGEGTTPSPSAVARQAGHFVAAIPTPTGFDLVRFDAEGPAGTLSVDEPFTWLGPHLAPRPGGGFVLAWQSPDLCVRFRLLSEDLVPEAPSAQVDGSCAGQAYRPRIAVGPTGRFVITFWNLQQDPPPFSCRARAAVFGADGSQVAPAFELGGEDGPVCHGDAHAAVNPAGDVLFVWNRDDMLTDSIQGKLIPKLLE